MKSFKKLKHKKVAKTSGEMQIHVASYCSNQLILVKVGRKNKEKQI